MTSTKTSLYQFFERLKQIRFVKFGLVGASGTIVNLSVLYLAQERLFISISNESYRLYVSLTLAILVATVNNFTWNTIWTWADRKYVFTLYDMLRVFIKYAVASWLGIIIQYSLTMWFSNYVHYLVANICSILLASIFNFLANDKWTFKIKLD